MSTASLLAGPKAPPFRRFGLADFLQSALTSGTDDDVVQIAAARPVDRRDRFATLLSIYRLSTASVHELGAAAVFQSHPAVAAIKQRCERDWLAELDGLVVPPDIASLDPRDAMRAIAARDRLPAIYKWLARDASWAEIVQFLALEGGPDGGFDDLVAACQIGLAGRAKLELATNYWDEMGNGDAAAVHTTLHQELAAALALPELPLADQPTIALERSALGGLLTTNRWLQPEALGALGLIELQAGPRCRLVLQGLERCDAPAAAFPFYRVHAEVDPRHGRDWLDNAIAPIVEELPQWGPRIVRGAYWRGQINAMFFDEVARILGVSVPAAAQAQT